MSDRPTAYWDYIRVDDLLGLQGGLAKDESELGNDEVLFVTVHQVYELWFKLVLRELRAARDLFTSEPVAEQELSGAVRSLKRATTIWRVAAHHFTVMETLTTRDYLAFRDKLMPASGFQSAQMRQVEILLGLPDEERIALGGADGDYKDSLRQADGQDSPALERVKAQLEDLPTLKDAIEEWLYRTPIDGHDPQSDQADERLSAFIESFLDAHEREVDAACKRATGMVSTETEKARIRELYERDKRGVRSFFDPSDAEGGRHRVRVRTAMLFIETYRELPLLAWPREVLDGLVEFEQAFLIFRQRHARMVERVIGRRTGTGGSSGVDYLDQTANTYRVFRDLWAMRTLQVREAVAPKLEHPEFYGFRNSD